MSEKTILKLEIPDWAEETRIYVFAGIELLATQEPFDGKLMVKVTRCNMCGKCCMDVSPTWFMGRSEDGNCKELIRQGEQYLCHLGIKRPFSCSKAEPNKNYCCIEFEEQKHV